MNPCPRCNYPGKDQRAQAGGRAGGRAKVKKGFAVTGQPDAAARKRAWQTRKANNMNKDQKGGDI
jgi:hypothetical protein